MTAPHPPSRLRQFIRLALKELREILRDRRTIITLVLMPLFLYPLLGGVVQKVLFSGLSRAASRPSYVLGFESDADFRRFSWMTGMDEVPLADTKTPEQQEGSQSADPVEAMLRTAAEPKFAARVPEEGEQVDLEKLAADREIDVGIRFKRDANQTGLNGADDAQFPVQLELIYASRSRFTQEATSALRRTLAEANVTWQQKLLRAAGQPADVPIDYTQKPVDPIEGPAFSLVTFIPLALILMTVTGAVYPAIDLTAGERERGTLETLIAAPVSRLGLLMAKFVAVLVVAMLTAMINLVAMLITLYVIGLDKSVFGDGGLTLTTVGIIIALLFVFAGFFSAVLLSVTSFARSFKEAQAYLIPLMLVSLSPGIFSLMPDIRMTGALAMVPLVNVVLTGRDVLQGTINGPLVLLSMGSTVVYGLLAMMVAARVFGTDSILYGSEGTWSDLLRRPDRSARFPGLSVGILCLVILVPTFMLLSSTVGRMQALSMESRLMLTAIVQSLFVLIPAALLWWNRVAFRSTFRLEPPRWNAVAGALLLGCALWPFAYEIGVFTTGEARQEELFRMFGSLRERIAAIPLVTRILALAVVPAVCEEWFFRGLLLSSLQGEQRKGGRSAMAAVVLSSLIFAAFHVLVQDQLFFERFLPSCLMGLVLGWVCVQSGSLLPGMLLHVLHNGLLLSLSEFKGTLGKLGLDLADQQHLPWPWLVGPAAVCLAGLWLVSGRFAPGTARTGS